MCSEVAERSGPDFPTVLAQPFAITLYAYQCLMERDRIRRLQARDEDITRAVFVAMAYNDPKLLDRERADVRADMTTPATRAARLSSSDELRALGLALAERIERGHVLDGNTVS